MKVAQKNPMNPFMQSVHISRASRTLNMDLSPSFHLSRNCQTSGIPFWMFSLPICNMQYRVRIPLALHILMSCLVLHLLVLYLLFLAPLLSGRHIDRCCPCNQLRHRRPFFLCSSDSRQANPLDHFNVAHSILFHACIRFCYCT